MKSHKALLVVLILSSANVNPQQIGDHRETVTPFGQASTPRQQVDLPAAPQPQKLDPTKLHTEAEELSKLAQSVPSDVDQLAQGKLPKDMSEELKRIEKLSKQLRNELTH